MNGVVLSSWERERVRSGMHAAAGRQVSTWVHAVIAGKASLLGGSLPIQGCSPSLRRGTSLESPHDPYDSLEVCHPSQNSPGIHVLNQFSFIITSVSSTHLGNLRGYWSYPVCIL
jgi:hypothetical protein